MDGLRDRLADRVVDLLGEIDFDREYHRLCTAPVGPPAAPDEEPFDLELELATVLSETGLGWRLFRDERVHRFQEEQDGLVTGLNVVGHPAADPHDPAPRHHLELVLIVRIAGQPCGDTFHGLARRLALRRDPAADPDPPYPRVPVADPAATAAAVRAGLKLYRRAADALRAHPTWPAAG